eukprot:TRINITY_DN17374_c0_g1_i5.p2 TRINITY_DN17374_c0_g1~~TRINITY_DN17374_c0_g1_i5.p2  ORF type:complete len:173 (-),score=32.84 TRINITY_DN17374_c0_g1_i5:14-532(-)
MGGEVPMTDDQRRSIVSNRQADSGAVTSLASQALSVLANRRAARDGRIRLDLVRQLELAVLDRNPLRRMDALAEIRKAGITDVEIAEDFIPHVARRLGDAWCEDNMSFADVTIGSARLQAMVRDLGPPEPAIGDRPVGRVAVIVREEKKNHQRKKQKKKRNAYDPGVVWSQG